MKRTGRSNNTGFAKRRDKNEPAIIRALEAVGCSVTPLNVRGVPDLLVGLTIKEGLGKGTPLFKTELIEVKGPKGKLTPDQEAWWREWKGLTPRLVRTPEDALRVMGLLVPQPGLWTFCPLMGRIVFADGRVEVIGCDGREPRCRESAFHQIGTYPRSDV
jgi:hypothetical protein